MLLWEFWRKDEELFPKEIFNTNNISLGSIPHCVIFVFDGSKDHIIDPGDEKFYKDLIDVSYKKGKTKQFNYRISKCPCNSNKN